MFSCGLNLPTNRLGVPLPADQGHPCEAGLCHKLPFSSFPSVSWWHHPHCCLPAPPWPPERHVPLGPCSWCPACPTSLWPPQGLPCPLSWTCGGKKFSWDPHTSPCCYSVSAPIWSSKDSIYSSIIIPYNTIIPYNVTPNFQRREFFCKLGLRTLRVTENLTLFPPFS